ncbi:ISAzo13 family transposase [Clostridium tagluense]|uniref:ISAzo13 family transposase n=1 Tax=Clostridium tagluense TaxID=360422 RepID=UPI001C6E6204|nr:ISAzo13 family transposase [Clostridium tagluense]MBW9159193.1 ISAzo13 family transposase [Clostridium tagluense]WLC68211.1 ISAzo13 family transposase [Clostridium tagluense]
MIHNFFGKCKDIFIENINQLRGSDKRIALAKVSKGIGKGGQSAVAKEFKVSRDTIRKGLHDLKSGIRIVDAFNARGRKNIEENLHSLILDVKDIVDCQSQTDPSFNTTRLFTRITVKEVRNQLIKQKGYDEKELPTNQTLNNKINKMGYNLKKVRKVKPLKKIEETDKIFENLKKVHDENKGKENVVRISIDTKDRVKVGDFSRGGRSRIAIKAGDHDFGNDYLTPFGILDLTNDSLELIFTQTKATSDFMVDSIEAYWLKSGYWYSKDTLIINADNGPENSSRRTQFVKRIIEFSATYNVKVILAYYPPYHSKYNPIERVWGSLEQHWNGDILDTNEAVLGFASSMTWNEKNPFVTLNESVYETGKKVEKNVMNIYETVLYRTKGIEKWFVTILPQKCKRSA